jgi:acetoacetyl-CoA synthetase
VRTDDYLQLWQWSVDEPEDFWRAVCEVFDVPGLTPGSANADILADATMPGARWFPGVELNYVEQVLRHCDRSGVAVIGVDELGHRTEIGWQELPQLIGALAGELRRLGVRRGDTVAGYLPDTAEAMVAFLAVASLGAIWSGCGQDYAPAGAAARLGQLRPKVLFSAEGYHYNGSWVDKRDDTAELQRLLPGCPPAILTHQIYGFPNRTLRLERVAFDHPLWVVFSSGTTGKPKGIVHGHGGVLLEHLKFLGLHNDLGTDDVFFWQTALSWVMWNIRTGGLLVGAAVVCYSGHPLHPNADRLWRILSDERVTYFGTSQGHLAASRKAGLSPGTDRDLSALKTVGCTGAPLSADLYRWVHSHVDSAVAICSTSGGTDVATAFVGGSAGIEAAPGELTVPYLAVDVRSWSPRCRSLRNEVGEMVVLAPMPSMPVAFWGDEDGSRYRAAYFEHEWEIPEAPVVWRHGDWITVTERGSTVIHGRSDATLNRNGVRMGSADIYEVVEGIDEIVEAFVLGVDRPDGTYWMPMFVTMKPGLELHNSLTNKIRGEIRAQLSPRHVPDDIIQAPGIPHTRTGKKLEVPITAMLAGRRNVSLDRRSVDNPDLIDWFMRYAK